MQSCFVHGVPSFTCGLPLHRFPREHSRWACGMVERCARRCDRQNLVQALHLWEARGRRQRLLSLEVHVEDYEREARSARARPDEIQIRFCGGHSLGPGSSFVVLWSMALALLASLPSRHVSQHCLGTRWRYDGLCSLLASLIHLAFPAAKARRAS